MRNVFDQYTQPENRITHALVTALGEDRPLLASFLRDVARVRAPAPARTLHIQEQKLPGQPESPEEEAIRRGIPDAWIFDDKGWCVVIESKVILALTADQIRRHISVARRIGFEEVHPLAITVRLPGEPMPELARVIEWRGVYAWLKKHAQEHEWAERAASYLEIAEGQMSEAGQLVEGTLTSFTGFPFGQDNPFTYGEAKRVLKLAMTDLRQHRDLQRRLGMDPELPGRKAITGKEDNRVWDFLQISPAKTAKNFTDHPHLTLGLNDERVSAMVTVPNSVKQPIRRRIVGSGYEDFQQMVAKILKNMDPILKKTPGSLPWFFGVQRRYQSRRSIPIVDARIEFDLRTAIESTDGSVKTQREWLEAAYRAFAEKNSNYQIQFGLAYPYKSCPAIGKPSALELVAKAWLACKPLTDLASK